MTNFKLQLAALGLITLLTAPQARAEEQRGPYFGSEISGVEILPPAKKDTPKQHLATASTCDSESCDLVPDAKYSQSGGKLLP